MPNVSVLFNIMLEVPSEKLFNKILEQDLDYIITAISDKTTENYYLDFKSTGIQDYTGRRKLFESEQKNLAKSISAFGNSEGGVIVWGIKTGKADTDYAVAKKPIKNVSNFISLIEGFTSILTSPPHPNVLSKIVYEDEKTDIGYVITHIPKSSKRPFQVINDKDFRYYIRAGSCSLPAPDTFLRSLFGQEPQPNAFLTFGVSPVEVDEINTIKMKIGVILHNGGENIARNVNGYVHVGGLDMKLEINKNTINDFAYYTNNISGLKIGFTAKPHFILGVEQEILPLTIHIDLKKPITENGIQIYALVSGDNQISHRLEITIEREELEKIYDNYIKDRDYNITEAILKTKRIEE